MLIFTSSTANNSSYSLSIIGDGTSTSLIIELEKAPFNSDIKSNLPFNVNFFSFEGIGTGTIVLNSDRRSVTISYDAPLSIGQAGGVTFVLYYQGK